MPLHEQKPFRAWHTVTLAVILAGMSMYMATLLLAGCRRGPEEETASSREVKDDQPRLIADPEHLAKFFLIPDFVGKLNKNVSIATGVPGLTTVRYHLGRDFPPTDFISGVRAHLASLGWSETVSSLHDVSRKKTGDEAGWIETGMKTPPHLTWEQWWVRGEEAMALSVTRVAAPGKQHDKAILADLDHYDPVGRRTLRSSPLRTTAKHGNADSHPRTSGGE